MDRPMVKVKLLGSKKEEDFLYDSGAQVSLMSKKIFRKIKVDLRPDKIDFKLSCSGVSGSKLKILGCYFFKFTVLGKEMKHPIFVVEKIPGQSGVLGIDIIKRMGLALDVIKNEPFIVNSNINEASVTKTTFIPARSRQLCNIKVPSHFLKKNNENLQVLQISVKSCKQIYPDEILIQPNEDGFSQVYLTNSSYNNQKIEKGTCVGEVESVSASEINPFPVSSTTPFAVPEEVKKRVVVPKLDEKRKSRILQSAHLSHLDPDLKVKYSKLLLKHHACISLDEFDLGSCNKGAHSIPTKIDSPPTYQKQFPLPIEHEKEIKRQVMEWLKIGIIRPCESEYNSSLFLVKKKPPPAKPGEVGPRPPAFRVVQDLRALNKETVPSNVRLPEIHECLDRIAGKKPTVFSSLDLRSGYFQLPIEKNSQEKTAFFCPSLGQQFCFNVTTQGLTSAPASFARTMQRIFSKQVAKNDLEVYLDDVLAYSKDHNEMLRTLDEAMQSLIDSGMKINIEKCQFGIKKLTYLGFELDKDGYKPDPIKSEGITKVNEPSTLKGVRSFMGMANFYRLLIPKFSQLTKPLTKLTCKGAWSGGEMPKSAKEAFEKCKKIFTKRPFLHYPDFNLKFHLFVDASLGDLAELKEGGLAGCLVQYPNDDVNAKCRPIGFCSRGLQKHEKNYSASLIETAGVIFAVEFFEKYLRTKFVCHTDHKPLTTIREGKVHKRTIERFREILADYDFTLEYTPGEKMPSDFMSRHVKVFQFDVNSISILSEKLQGVLKEDLETKVKNEGQTCATSTAWVSKVEKSAHVTSKDSSRSDKELHARAKSCWARAQEAAVQAIRAEECAQHTTQAKQAAKAVVEPEKNECAKIVTMQSQPCAKVGAVSENESQTKEASAIFAQSNLMKDKLSEASNLAQKLSKLCVSGVRSKLRSFNFLDTSTDKNPDLLKKQQSIDPFIQAVKYFVTDKVLPTQRYRNIIKRWGPDCFEKNGIMMIRYNRIGYPTRDLVIAPGERIANIIAEAHGSLLGGHSSTEKTVQQILTNYWFQGIYTEVEFFIENCSICQRMKKKSKKPNTFLKPLKQADQIFERVHLDLFGPLKTHTGKAYVCSMVDSFSKFAIFSVIPTKDAETVAKCFFDNWISIFGSPLSIVTDRGTDFHTETMQKVCDYLQIDKRVITTKHPESNGQVEILNKKLKKYLTAMEKTETRDWPELVNSCQYSYNLSVHKALKNSPYHVLFGIDPNTPLNNKGFRTKAIYGEDYQHTMGKRLQRARKLAQSNNMSYRDDYVKRFNKSVEPHDFREGMMVYLHRPEQLKINPKLQSPWFGPFVILTMIGKANALIQEISNFKTKFVNVNRLRAYNATIAQWQKVQNRSKKKNNNADSQQEKNGTDDHAHASNASAPNWVQFDVDNEVTLLNPHVDPVPMPCPDIKLEEPELEESVQSEIPSNEPAKETAATLDPIIDDPGPSTSSKRESLIETATKLFLSPRRDKRLTRQERLDQGLELETESGVAQYEKLKLAEKAGKKKSQKKK